jgi:hypothetical protein
MIKRLAGLVAALISRGRWSCCAGPVVAAPTVLIRVSLVIIASVALAVAASPGPARATLPKPGGRIDGVLRTTAAASGSGWSVTASPNPRAGNGLFGAAEGPQFPVPRLRYVRLLACMSRSLDWG